MEKPLSLVSNGCKLPTGDGVYCGVSVEPYVLVKRGEATVTYDDVPEEGSPDGLYQLRSRWYRSTIPRGGAICSIHPDREAGLQCNACLRTRVAQHLSYHCTAECLKTHWHQHKEYHKQALLNGSNPEHGSMGHGNDGSIANKTGSMTLDTWVEVGRTRIYTPCQEDVGYVLKYEVSVVNRLHPYTDLGKMQLAYSTRVRPLPTPPIRQLLQLLPPVSPAVQAGRFSVLSYNMLADLYAKVLGHMDKVSVKATRFWCGE
eukprot:gene10483-8447_t